MLKNKLKRNHTSNQKHRDRALQLVNRRAIFAAVILGKMSYYTQKIIDSLKVNQEPPGEALQNRTFKKSIAD